MPRRDVFGTGCLAIVDVSMEFYILNWHAEATNAHSNAASPRFLVPSALQHRTRISGRGVLNHPRARRDAHENPRRPDRRPRLVPGRPGLLPGLVEVLTSPGRGNATEWVLLDARRGNGNPPPLGNTVNMHKRGG